MTKYGEVYTLSIGASLIVPLPVLPLPRDNLLFHLYAIEMPKSISDSRASPLVRNKSR